MRRLVIPLALVPLVGCAPYSAVRRPMHPELELPASFSVEAEAREEVGGARFWTAFGEPALDAVVDQVLEQNFQLRAAWARIRQGEMAGLAAASGWWPQVQAQIDFSRRRSVLVLPEPVGTRAIENDNFGLSVPVSYELDLWDRVGSQTRAAAFETMALREDVEALAITLAASTVEAWFNVLQQRESRTRVLEQIALGERTLELLELRFGQGLVGGGDVLSQRAQLDGLRAQLAASEAQERLAANQLAALSGAMPGSVVVPARCTQLPVVPPIPSVGVPSRVLFERPDVRAARHRIEAADQRVAAAVADRFPRLNLGGSLGFASPNLATLFESFVYSLVSGLVGPLFDGERREAAVQQQHAIVWERTEQLGQVLVTAVHEVENALLSEAAQVEQTRILEGRVEALREAHALTEQRFAAGLLESAVPVLLAASNLAQAELALVGARRQALSHRVQLVRALGGPWTRDLESPTARRPVAEPQQEAR